MVDALQSKTIKAGQRTYFLDLKEAKNGNKYLVLTELQSKENNEKERKSILVFEDHFEDFKNAIAELI